MLPPALWRNGTVRGTTIVGMIVNLVFYGVVFTLSLFFQSVWQASPMRTGVAFLPMMGVLMLMNLVAGRLGSRVGARTLATAGLLISAVGYLAMWPALTAATHAMLVLPMLLAGSGIALTIPTITHAMLASVGGERSGIASGLLNAARQVGGVMGVALFGYLVRDPAPAAFMHGMTQALIASAALLVAGAVVASRCLGPARERRRAPRDERAACTRANV
jgi:MFS transporter, DHA2 family, methylenomycin A resistance protein